MRKHKQAIDACAASYLGQRVVNQDSVYADVRQTPWGQVGAFCVADGMGGLTDGKRASSRVIEQLGSWWEQLALSSDVSEIEIEAQLAALIRRVNHELLTTARENKLKMGTTCSILLALFDFYTIVHLGDSRIYRMSRRRFRKKQLHQLTQDHSWKMQKLIEGVSLEAIKADPNRDKLTSGVGVKDSPTMQLYSRGYTPQDVFVLCSDGLYRVIASGEFLQYAKGTSQNMAEALIHEAKKRNTSDNASVIAVRVNKKKGG